MGVIFAVVLGVMRAEIEQVQYRKIYSWVLFMPSTNSIIDYCNSPQHLCPNMSWLISMHEFFQYVAFQFSRNGYILVRRHYMQIYGSRPEATIESGYCEPHSHMHRSDTCV